MEREFSRRERQIMDILYRSGKASAAEVQVAIPDGPGYSAVRALLRILEEKGHVRHEEKGGKYIYLPAVSRDRAKRPAMRRLVDTFFEGSVEKAVVAFLSPAGCAPLIHPRRALAKLSSWKRASPQFLHRIAHGVGSGLQPPWQALFSAVASSSPSPRHRGESTKSAAT